VQIEPH